MPDCPKRPICSFYEKAEDREAERATPLLERYCRGNYAACARYAVAKALGYAAVPAALSPHDHAEARRLLRSH